MSTIVYSLSYPDSNFNTVVGEITFHHKPFYIGIGKTTRPYQHLKEADKTHNRTIKHNIIRKIRKEYGQEPIINILKSFTDRNDALQLEAELVEFFGKIANGTGILSNICDGGHNNPVLPGCLNPMFGRPLSEESRTKAVSTFKNTINSEKYKKEIAPQINAKRRISAYRFYASMSSEERAVYFVNRNHKKYENRPDLLARHLEVEARKQKAKQRFIERKAQNLKNRQQVHEYKQSAEYREYIKNLNRGENNPMYGRGEQLIGAKNGRARFFCIKIDCFIFIVHGKIKQFAKEFKAKFKANDILRGKSFRQRYGVKIASSRNELDCLNAIVKTEKNPEGKNYFSVIAYNDILDLDFISHLNFEKVKYDKPHQNSARSSDISANGFKKESGETTSV